jgi:hypothetical protein
MVNSEANSSSKQKQPTIQLSPVHVLAPTAGAEHMEPFVTFLAPISATAFTHVTFVHIGGCMQLLHSAATSKLTAGHSCAAGIAAVGCCLNAAAGRC